MVIAMDESQYSDRAMLCLECGQTYTWQAGEQYYYASKHLLDPRRCPACRKRRKDSIRTTPPAVQS